MTHEEREALRGLCEEATSGPWIASSSCDGEVVYRIRNGDYYPIIAAERAVDAAFIAAARTALPELLEENKTLFAEKLDLLSQLELMRLRAEAAEARAEALEAERDEAIEDLNELIPLCCEAGLGACDFCISNGEDCHGDDPSWRGLEGGE